jgi:HAD superfamily hydrolase (TIGR01549 family)
MRPEFARFRAVAFDVGGTLYVSPEFDALVEDQAHVALARVRGCSVGEARRLLADQRAKNEESLGDTSKVRALEDLGVRREEFQDAAAALDPTEYLRGARQLPDLFQALHTAGMKVGVLSNFKEVLVRRVFGCLGIDWDSVDAAVCVDDGLPIKPSPVPFEALCSRLGMSPGDTVFVGDSLAKDLTPAKRLGMGTVLIRGSKVDGDEAVADLVLDEVTEIIGRS